MFVLPFNIRFTRPHIFFHLYCWYIKIFSIFVLEISSLK